MTAASTLSRWIDQTILELGREFRWSYLPPLMVYAAAGISGLTGIVGLFFVKEYLGLSAAFLAGLGFWAGIPWALKMPLGHIVDLIWRRKSLLVYLGAALIAANLAIMYGLIVHTEAMAGIMPVEAWFVLAALLAPVGYVVQDVVADAMTVEAVPDTDDDGNPLPDDQLKLMHTTMQTLGRVAIIGGGLAVALVNVLMFSGVRVLSQDQRAEIYGDIYLIAFLIPVVSVLGVILGGVALRRRAARLAAGGMDTEEIHKLLFAGETKTQPNWHILIGSAIFVVFTLTVGLTKAPFSQEIVFVGSMVIVLYLMVRLIRELEPGTRAALVGTAVIIFVYRALPFPGAGVTWWQIDVLGFDQQFISRLTMITAGLTLFGMFIFRRFMAEKSIAYVVGFLTVATTILFLPIVGMYYGLHHWTGALTGGVVDARFIAVFDTALESPLGQVAMIPMLAWIAKNAPNHLKATFFAVMASFTNLALSASQLGTKYLNEIFAVTREVKDRATGQVKVPADYSELGWILIAVTAIGLILPLFAIAVIQLSPLRTKQ